VSDLKISATLWRVIVERYRSPRDATARDGLPYHNVYTWYFQMKDAKVIKGIAFFDTRVFDEFWTRVSPKP
jgi:ketosteroid isomerase-like protein